jgi:predicted nucleic-acid-binding protein
MIAIDSNIFIRLLVSDAAEDVDARMAAAGRALLQDGGVYVPVTVSVESYWFMRRRLKLRRDDVAGRYRDALATDAFAFEQAERVVEALEAASHGIEFDDALHALATPSDLRFATFDQDLARRWPKLDSPVAVIVPEFPQSTAP